MEQLTKENFLIYAAQHYNNPHCTSIHDFDQDCKRFVIARTLMRNFYKRNKVPIRLLLNHVVICNNVFGPRATVKLFLYYCEPELWPCCVAIFDYLNILQEDIENIDPDQDIVKLIKEQ